MTVWIQDYVICELIRTISIYQRGSFIVTKVFTSLESKKVIVTKVFTSLESKRVIVTKVSTSLESKRVILTKVSTSPERVKSLHDITSTIVLIKTFWFLL